MTLWDRRQRWVTIGLAGLESAVLALAVSWLAGPSLSTPTWLLAVGLWGMQCLWMAIIDLMNSMELSDAGFRWRVLAAIVVSFLVLLRIVVYPRLPLGDLSWLASTWHNLLAFNAGVPRELLAFLANLLLWARALQASGRSLPFSQLKGNVRRLWILSAIVAVASSRNPAAHPFPVLVACYPLGLLVLLISHTDEKAANAASTGAFMPLPVTLQIVLLIAAICVIGLVPLLTTADFLTPLAEKKASVCCCCSCSRSRWPSSSWSIRR